MPETNIVFIGAGERTLAYDVREPRRLWEDTADCEFWGWKRFDEIVIMETEIELAAWTIQGDKLWTTFVEPPWSYDIKGDSVTLDVMGSMSEFALKTGPVN